MVTLFDIPMEDDDLPPALFSSSQFDPWSLLEIDEMSDCAESQIGHVDDTQ